MLKSSIKTAFKMTLATVALLPIMAGGALAFDLTSLKDSDGADFSAEAREVSIEGIATQKDLDFIIDTYEFAIAGIGNYQLASVIRKEDKPRILRAHFFLEGENNENWETGIFLNVEDIAGRGRKDPDAYTILYIQAFLNSIYEITEVRLTNLVKGSKTPVHFTSYKYDHASGDTEHVLSLIWRQVDEQVTNMQFVRKNLDNTKEDFDRYEELMSEVSLQE